MEGNIRLVQAPNPESASTYAGVFTEIAKEIKGFFSGKLIGEAIEAI